MGPVTYLVTAGDLHALTPGNRLCKYADDTYLIVPPANINTRIAELSNIETWAQANNITINCYKSVEIIFTSHKPFTIHQAKCEQVGWRCLVIVSRY